MSEHVEHGPHGFVRRYIFSTDHKVIGIQYLLTAMLVAVVAGVLAMMMRMQLAWPESRWPLLERILPEAVSNGVMKPEFYLSMVTMHGTLMAFFVISFALVGGFGNYPHPAADRRARHGLSAAEHAVLLGGAAGHTDRPGFVFRGRRRGRLRLDGLPALERGEASHTRIRHGTDLLAAGHGAVHRLLHHGRAELLRHHDEPARAAACP